MESKQIHDLIRLVSKLGVSEVKIEEGDFKISIRTELPVKALKGGAAVPMPLAVSPVAAAPAAPPAPVAAEAPKAEADSDTPAKAAAEDTSSYVEVKSPMIGTFYRSPGPDKDVFVKVGDKISEGDVVCIVEAMKLFNEIESEVSGTIVKVLVDNSSPVEYDQPLFLVDPS